jgi:glycosyltransferase involved in cell wall biosynthesis
MNKPKIVMITMFKNEAKVIERMLNSCLGNVDYYVMQNNGSTDGSDEIAKKFLIDHKLSGEIYDIEEGWVGFGYNRDHLIRYCQSTDHGCDWILKMDCDEVLEVDDDFDWSLLSDKSIQAFDITAQGGSCLYYRTWMWNANIPWAFHHDPCHETIYSLDPNIGSNYKTHQLPNKIRQRGFNEGQSWSDPKKFINHSLELEQELIRDDSFFTRFYHFWYLAKSYFDATWSPAFPLGESQQKEFARRAIYYYREYVNASLRVLDKDPNAWIEHEMCYFGLVQSAYLQRYLGDIESCIKTLEESEWFAPDRNDHLISLAELYRDTEDFENMFKVTSILMQPERTNPFPRRTLFIEEHQYNDSKTGFIQGLHEMAISRYKPKSFISPLAMNPTPSKRMFIVDNFYANPDAVRQLALTQVEFEEDIRWYKGKRSTRSYLPDGIKERFESIIGQKITRFEEYGMNGVFQITTSKDPQVYHYDGQEWAAMIYLTPNAPVQSGTRLHRSNITGARSRREPNVEASFNGDFFDSTKFDTVDVAGNIYNRLVIMDASCIHSAGNYFGNSDETGRLIHLFFFD